jgi:seryl-tRNA synthetase
MKRLPFYFFSLVFISIFSGKLLAQDVSSDYEKIITQRAAKIVSTLKLGDSAKSSVLTTIIASQYRNLGKIHDEKNQQKTTLKKQQSDKALIEEGIKKLESDADEKLQRLHSEYLSTLSSLLTAQQVDQVKDGMTYDVLHVTYNAYLDMIPRLSEEQKNQIMDWLMEAREHAMDAESSEKKHWWFGKYKGRINNYLSAAGYNMKKEEEDWQKRRNAEKGNSGK